MTKLKSGYFSSSAEIYVDYATLIFYDQETGLRDQAPTFYLFEKFYHVLAAFVVEHPIFDFRNKGIQKGIQKEKAGHKEGRALIQLYPLFPRIPVKGSPI